MLVLAEIRAAGAQGINMPDEVEDPLQMQSTRLHPQGPPHLHELMKAGRIAEGGVRKTRSGRNATVWRGGAGSCTTATASPCCARCLMRA